MRARRSRRAAVAELEHALAGYEDAVAASRRAADELRRARRERRREVPVDEPYDAVTEALTRLVRAAEHGHQLAVGPLTGLSPTAVKRRLGTQPARAWYGRVVAARAALQEHLLAAGPDVSVRQPEVVPTDGSVDLGPFWPVTDYLDITAQAPRRPGRRPPRPTHAAAVPDQRAAEDGGGQTTRTSAPAARSASTSAVGAVGSVTTMDTW